MRGGAVYDASETTIGQIARQLELAERDRLCYLFDYSDEWRFYAICKEIDEIKSSDKAPDVEKEHEDAVERYGPVDEAW